jgi:hypothetical protein
VIHRRSEWAAAVQKRFVPVILIPRRAFISFHEGTGPRHFAFLIKDMSIAFIQVTSLAVPPPGRRIRLGQAMSPVNADQPNRPLRVPATRPECGESVGQRLMVLRAWAFKYSGRGD